MTVREGRHDACDDAEMRDAQERLRWLSTTIDTTPISTCRQRNIAMISRDESPCCERLSCAIFERTI